MGGVSIAASGLLVVGFAWLATVGAACQQAGGGSFCARGTPFVEIASNHGHRVMLAAEDVDQGADKLFAVAGGEHEHALLLRSTDFAQIRSGVPLRSRTSSVRGHSHEIEVTCQD